MMTDGASGLKGEIIKPIGNELKRKCPCESFLWCCSRVPYGTEVWNDLEKREQALGDIYYISESNYDITQIPDLFKQKFKRPYKTIDLKVMLFRKLNEFDVTKRLEVFKSRKLSNAGDFTDLQKSLILRSNLVKNGLVLRSDSFNDKGDKTDKPEKLVPFSKDYNGSSWNIDHHKVRAKGGCNRFCNASLMSRKENTTVKVDDGLGCICVDVLKEGTTGEIGLEFEHQGEEVTKYVLWNCKQFSLDVKNKEKFGYKVSTKPLGSIQQYKEKLCGLDNPLLKFSPNNIADVAEQICDSEE